MIMNRLGKGLVLFNTAVSILALAWALGLFLQFTDWGWKEPRSDLGKRIPSEYDKRTAAFKEAVKASNLALVGLSQAQASLREAEEHFGRNHLFYNRELTRLQSATEPIEVKAVKMAGPVILDTPGKAIGKPVLDEKVEGIAKSYDAYLIDLKNINEEIKKEIAEIGDKIAKAREITVVLNGKDDTGKVVPNTVGVYALIEGEKKAQDATLAEKEYLQPIWSRALEQAQAYSDRRLQLQKTLEQIRGNK